MCKITQCVCKITHCEITQCPQNYIYLIGKNSSRLKNLTLTPWVVLTPHTKFHSSILVLLDPSFTFTFTFHQYFHFCFHSHNLNQPFTMSEIAFIFDQHSTVDSTADSIFLVILVALANTVFVNATNMTIYKNWDGNAVYSTGPHLSPCSNCLHFLFHFHCHLTGPHYSFTFTVSLLALSHFGRYLLSLFSLYLPLAS